MDKRTPLPRTMYTHCTAQHIHFSGFAISNNIVAKLLLLCFPYRYLRNSDNNNNNRNDWRLRWWQHCWKYNYIRFRLKCENFSIAPRAFLCFMCLSTRMYSIVLIQCTFYVKEEEKEKKAWNAGIVQGKMLSSQSTDET